MLCDLCPRSFKQKDLLANHMKRDHQLRQCELCDKLVTSVKDMADHLKEAHVIAKCAICGVMYGHHYLLTHLRSHMSQN